jgi:hypothetical protein
MTIRSLAICLLSCLLLAACGNRYTPPPVLNNQSGTEHLPEGRKSPEIFELYSAGGDSVMSTHWPRKFDASGVAWDDKHTCTLITRRHVVMAAHYMRHPGKAVIFHDRSGKRIVRKMVAAKKGSGDYAVGLLDKPVPSNYTAYLLPRPSEFLKAKLMYQPAVITDQHRRLYFHQIIAFTGGKIAFRHNKLRRGQVKNLVSGDSGNPSFIIVGGKQILIETHTTGGPGTGPFYGDAKVQAEIRQMVSALDRTYSIRTIEL